MLKQTAKPAKIQSQTQAFGECCFIVAFNNQFNCPLLKIHVELNLNSDILQCIVRNKFFMNSKRRWNKKKILNVDS